MAADVIPLMRSAESQIMRSLLGKQQLAERANVKRSER
jgi:hypothetical protein